MLLDAPWDEFAATIDWSLPTQKDEASDLGGMSCSVTAHSVSHFQVIRQGLQRKGTELVSVELIFSTVDMMVEENVRL